jgi:hypothetical protein
MRHIAPLLAHPLQLVVLFGFSLAGCSWSAGAQSATHIEVAREVMMESGTSITPYSITRAPDGGYVITGAVAMNHAWATRLTPSLMKMWRIEEPERSVGKARDTSTYSDAVGLQDNSTLLCGMTQVGPRGITGVALITRVAPNGQVIQRQELPLPGEYTLVGPTKCVRTKDGVAVLAHGVRGGGVRNGQPAVEGAYWFAALDETGTLKTQKVIPDNSQGAIEQVVELPNGNVASYTNTLNCVEFNTEGDVRAQRSGTDFPILSWEHEGTSWGSAPKGGAGAETLHDRYQQQTGQKAKNPSMGVRLVYALPDGAFALFGNHEKGDVFTAAVGYLSKNLSSFELQVLETRTEVGSWVIADAAPTGVPGEFATVRGVSTPPLRSGGNDPRMGISLDFVRFK